MMWSISDEKEDEFDGYLKSLMKWIQENWRFIKRSGFRLEELHNGEKEIERRHREAYGGKAR
ncbi:hypothetical protein F2Q68_00034835 [Brassica cretica]|uniref:Uncharacterized protein n=1 Tax=Brassica cretica TaxID=69181 RepID=A0A8S9H4Y1_BRACR|nr:hypothetical protein F2Q68_00034835 [Brassica cretica]